MTGPLPDPATAAGLATAALSARLGPDPAVPIDRRDGTGIAS